METFAKLKHAKISAQKARLVADLVRGLSVTKAFDILTFSTKKAAKLIKKILESAIANAENNQGADVDELKVSKIFADTGSIAKRWQARAKGRSTRIEKHSCHITVFVSDE